MKKARIIARLDVKGPNVIKGVHLECLRVVGKPGPLATKYYEEGADELLYMDIVASLYGRDNLLEIVNQASDHIFIPFTVGGGVRSLDDMKALIKAGADKVAINTMATKDSSLITRAAQMFGSQCVVISIEAKKTGEDHWEAFTDNGRERTGLDVVSWAKKAEELGAGEILLTSIDTEGTQKGYDIELIKKITENANIPVIACGGAGNAEDVAACIVEGKTDAVAVASVLHYDVSSIGEIKETLEQRGIPVRKND